MLNSLEATLLPLAAARAFIATAVPYVHRQVLFDAAKIVASKVA